MKTKTKHNLAMALAAAFAFILSLGSASAQLVTAATGDLLFGIRVTGGTGLGTDYIASLGSNTNFLSPTNTPLDLSSRIDLTTIQNTYGVGWQNRSDLFWSVSGTPNGTILYGSSVNANGTTTGQSVVYKSTSTQAVVGTNMDAQLNGLLADTANGGTAYAALVPSSASQSLTKTIAGQSGTFISPYNDGTNLFGNLASAPFEHNNNGAVGYSDLYRMAGVTKGTANAQLLGTFVLTTDGSLGATTLQYGLLPLTPVPEPATCATGVLTLGMAGTMLIRRFRRKSVRA